MQTYCEGEGSLFQYEGRIDFICPYYWMDQEDKPDTPDIVEGPYPAWDPAKVASYHFCCDDKCCDDVSVKNNIQLKFFLKYYIF